MPGFWVPILMEVGGRQRVTQTRDFVKRQKHSGKRMSVWRLKIWSRNKVEILMVADRSGA